jgi:hypothetical protein
MLEKDDGAAGVVMGDRQAILGCLVMIVQVGVRRRANGQQAESNHASAP